MMVKKHLRLNNVFVSWDWRENPDWNKILSIVSQIKDPMIFDINTRSDENEILITDQLETQKKAQDYWEYLNKNNEFQNNETWILI